MKKAKAAAGVDIDADAARYFRHITLRSMCCERDSSSRQDTTALAELAVQLVFIALAFHRADLFAVGQRHVEVAGGILLLANCLDVVSLPAGGINHGDEFVFGAHTFRIDPLRE